MIADYPELDLFIGEESSASLRVRLAVELKSIPIRLHYVDLSERENRGKAYMSLNPQGMVPFLKSSCGTELSQSLCIIDWLDEVFPQSPIYPSNTRDRYLAKSLIHQIACDVSPYQKRTMQRYLSHSQNFDDDTVKIWLEFWIKRGLAPIEEKLSQLNSKGGFAFEERPTIFECFLYPQVLNCRKWGIDISEFLEIEKCVRVCGENAVFNFE